MSPGETELGSKLFSQHSKSLLSIFLLRLSPDFFPSMHERSDGLVPLTSNERGRQEEMKGGEEIGASGFSVSRSSCFQMEACRGPDLTALWNGYKLDSLPPKSSVTDLKCFPL